MLATLSKKANRATSK